MINELASYMSEGTFHVVVSTEFSRVHVQENGVPQGKADFSVHCATPPVSHRWLDSTSSLAHLEESAVTFSCPPLHLSLSYRLSNNFPVVSFLR